MGPLDWRHAFLVGYAVEKGPCVTRTSLVSHTDDRCVGATRWGNVKSTENEERRERILCDLWFLTNVWSCGGPCVGGCSEVTLNVCLGREFIGGELYFGALRGEGGEDEVVLTYQPQPGRAVIHPGKPI